MRRETDHPRARIVAMTLGHAADVLASDWRRGGYGVPEVLADVTTHDTFTRILCERALSEAGVDVFWNDLVCSTPKQAGDAVRAVAERGIDFEALYGPNYEALLGVLQGCILMDSGQLASLVAAMGRMEAGKVLVGPDPAHLRLAGESGGDDISAFRMKE